MQLAPRIGFGARTGGAPVPSFAPPDISGLRLWLDASDISSITPVAGSVSQWSDKSGNGHHATQGAGARQPKTGVNSMGGQNVLAWNASSMILPSGVGSIFGGSWTWIFVNKGVAPQNPADAWYIGTNGTAGLWQPSTGTFRVGSPASGWSGAEKSMTQQAHIFVGTRSGANVAAYVDGGMAGVAANATNKTVTNVYIGSVSTSGKSGLETDYAEILAYDRLLSRAEINDIGGAYLSPKWGIAWTNL